MRTRAISSVLFVALCAAALLACESPEAPATDGLLERPTVDLTYPFNEETVYWPTAPQEFELTEDHVGETEAGFYYAAYWFRGSEHGGTHMDAPKHFAEGHPAAHEVPVDQLMGPAVVVDVSDQALEDRDYQITTEDLQTWEDEYGRIPDGAILLFRTGYGQYYPDREQYMGTAERGQEALENLHFPGLHPEAAQWLADNRSIKAAGLDTPSIDYGQSAEFMAHRHLFPEDIVVLENLANLDQLPATGAHVIALPMKIEDGSGGPLRAVAFLPNER